MATSKYIQYIKEFHHNNQVELTFVYQHLDKHLNQEWVIEDQTEIEHILDFLYQKPDMDISKVWYKVLAQKANKWSMTLQLKASKKDTEVRNKDWSVSLDFKDGFKFVKLKSKQAFEREGKLMSHCVAGYHGREGIEIHSLRDEKNNPHCTIEIRIEWSYINQIKWKGNGSIDPKYIDYVVRFLEKKGKDIRDYDMKNLGYRTIDNIPFADQLGLKAKAYRWRFLHTEKSIDWVFPSWFDNVTMKELPAILDQCDYYKDKIPPEWWIDKDKNISMISRDYEQRVPRDQRLILVKTRQENGYDTQRVVFGAVIVWRVNNVIAMWLSHLEWRNNVIHGSYRNSIIGDENLLYWSGCIKGNKNTIHGSGYISGNKNICMLSVWSNRNLTIQWSDNRIMMGTYLHWMHLTVLDGEGNTITYFSNGKPRTIFLHPMTQYRFHTKVGKHKVRLTWYDKYRYIQVLAKYKRSYNQLEQAWIDTNFPLLWSQSNT